MKSLDSLIVLLMGMLQPFFLGLFCMRQTISREHSIKQGSHAYFQEEQGATRTDIPLKCLQTGGYGQDFKLSLSYFEATGFTVNPPLRFSRLGSEMLGGDPKPHSNLIYCYSRKKREDYKIYV